MERDDAALLRAWRDGDREAGNELFERYFPLVHRFFRYKVEDEIVVDLIQATFLVCVESRDDIREASSYRGYLLAVARHKLLDHFRAKRRSTVPLEEVALSRLDPSPSSVLRRGRTARSLLEALRELPIDAQVLLELHYWEELPGPELARILDIPEGTVRSRLKRARELLLGRIEALDGLPGRDLVRRDFDRWAADVRAELER